MREPATNPCGSCPYRKDVPSGVWHEEEYQKLPGYDGDMIGQPLGVFGCHQQDGRLCAGWVACHDMDENLALRIAVGRGHIDGETFSKVLTYETEVEIWESGQAAHDHGVREISNPSVKAEKTITKLSKKLKSLGVT